MSELPLDSKAHRSHPEHPDNHPLRKHHDHHEPILRMCGVFLLCVIFLAFLLGVATDAPFASVLLSFAPSVVLAISVMALAHADNLHLEHLVALLLVLLIVFGLVLSGAAAGADVFAVMSLNLIIGSLFILVLQQSYTHHEQPRLPGVVHERKPEGQSLLSLFADIEERSKSINTSIGRTYSVYKNATSSMRNEIKIPSRFYSELDPDRRSEVLRENLMQIASRLEVLKQKEKDVFSAEDYKKLKRKENRPVIEVIASFEGEGIRQIHASALSLVQQALAKLD